MLDPQLIARFNAQDRRALARLITRIDNDPSCGPAVLDELGPPAKRAGSVGITGAPGVGKSTLLGRLIGGCRANGRRVAVLAFDPQSPISGGALLGDRIRMAEPAARDEDVFIRSLSNRGASGGLSASVRWISRLLERFGYDMILVETVGVGQSELAVLRVADVVVLVVMPGTGDTVQWEKAGLVEVAHMVVINKSDHPGVDRVEQELREAIGNGGRGRAILKTVASENVGIDAVLGQIDALLADRPATEWHQARTEILQEAEMLLSQRLEQLARENPELAELAHAVADGRMELSSAAAATIRLLLPSLSGADASIMRLIRPNISFRDEFLAYCREFRDAGEPFVHDQLDAAESDFAALLERWEQISRGENLDSGLVPQDVFWLVCGQRIIGTARLRHTLNEALLSEGGHIGYEIRPTERGRGHATRLLALVLDKARALGLTRVLLTCEKTNTASAGVMLKNGAKLENEIPSVRHPGQVAQRYWIELTR